MRTSQSPIASLFAVALAIAPIAGLIASGGGVGCSSDKSNGGGGAVVVDPGGTYGAEVTVEVKGRGRVTGSIADSIDCPTNCFVRYTFANQSAPGAGNGLDLKAVATMGTRFTGWKFSNDTVATKGRGPDNCNPVKRPASQPGDSNSDTIKLAFGETNGSPPPGQEGSCTGNLVTVPLAYKVTATFEEIPIPDAGIDVNDGGPGLLVFETPAAGATGGDLAYNYNAGRIYWKYHANGADGIAYGTAGGSTTPSSGVTASYTIPRFEGDPNAGIVFTQSNGTVGVFSYSSYLSSPYTYLSGFPGSCDAVDSYGTSSSTVFCVSGGTLYQATTGSSTVTPVLTGAPGGAGRQFAVDGSYFYFVSDPGGAGAAKIVQVSRSAVDGGTPTFTDDVTGQTNPTKLETNGSYLYWINYDSVAQAGEVRSASAGVGANSSTPVISSTVGLRYIALDPSSSSTVYAAVVPPNGPAAKILKGTAFGGSVTTVVDGIRDLSGLAVDSSYVYWTQNDGRVYRYSKF